MNPPATTQFVGKLSDQIILTTIIELSNSRSKTVTVCNRQLLSQGLKLLPKSSIMFGTQDYIRTYQKEFTATLKLEKNEMHFTELQIPLNAKPL